MKMKVFQIGILGGRDLLGKKKNNTAHIHKYGNLFRAQFLPTSDLFNIQVDAISFLLCFMV